MAVFFDKIDAAPLANSNFTFEFNTWVANLIDTLNEILAELEALLDENFGPQPFTQAEIILMAPNARDGVIWYCTDHVPPVYVGKENGALVQFTTAPFP
jgi:hypothetical protein